MPANVPQSVVRHPAVVPSSNVPGNSGQQQFFGPPNEQINSETQITNLGKYYILKNKLLFFSFKHIIITD